MTNNAIKIRLHNADAIKKFVNVVRDFVSDINIMTDRSCLDAKSIMGVYTLNLSDDTYVEIISDNISEIRMFDAAMEEFK